MDSTPLISDLNRLPPYESNSIHTTYDIHYTFKYYGGQGANHVQNVRENIQRLAFEKIHTFKFYTF